MLGSVKGLITVSSRRALLSASSRARGALIVTAGAAAAMPTPLYNEERKPLVVVGSINADLVAEVDRLPKPGETLAADSLKVFPGGKVISLWMQAANAASRGPGCRVQVVALCWRPSVGVQRRPDTLCLLLPDRRAPTKQRQRRGWATPPTLWARCVGCPEGLQGVGAAHRRLRSRYGWPRCPTLGARSAQAQAT